MIDPNETDDDKRKRELLMVFRRGYAAGVRGSAYDPRFTAHERGDISETYLRAYGHGANDAHLAAAKEAERLGYDARMSILRGKL